MQLSLTKLVCVLFDPAIPTSSFNFIQLFLYLYYIEYNSVSYSTIVEQCENENKTVAERYGQKGDKRSFGR